MVPFVFIFVVNTASFKSCEYVVKCECDECYMTLRYEALLLSEAEYSSERAIN